MAWNDGEELVVGGSGQVYSAAVGTALPTTAEATPNSAFEGLGYHTEDGVSVSNTPEIQEILGWQSRYPLRRLRVSETFTVTFALLQWNEVNVPVAFGGGEVVSDGGSGYRYNPPTPDDAIVERAFIVDVDDGDDRLRFVLPRGNAVETVESQFVRNQAAVLPVTVSALESEGSTAWYLLTDKASAFAAGS